MKSGGTVLDEEGTKNGDNIDNGSILEETESVVTEEVALNVDLLSAEAVTLSPDETAVVDAPPSSTSECCLDVVSVDSGNIRRGGVGRKKSLSGRDWWWKQDGRGGSESGRVKDYVMEWIGSEIKKERPNGEWNATTISVEGNGNETVNVKAEEKKHRKRFEWRGSLDEERIQKQHKKNRKKPREWWKEEFCDELAKKKKKREVKGSCGGREMSFRHPRGRRGRTAGVVRVALIFG